RGRPAYGTFPTATTYRSTPSTLRHTKSTPPHPGLNQRPTLPAETTRPVDRSTDPDDDESSQRAHTQSARRLPPSSKARRRPPPRSIDSVSSPGLFSPGPDRPILRRPAEENRGAPGFARRAMAAAATSSTTPAATTSTTTTTTCCSSSSSSSSSSCSATSPGPHRRRFNDIERGDDCCCGGGDPFLALEDGEGAHGHGVPLLAAGAACGGRASLLARRRRAAWLAWMRAAVLCLLGLVAVVGVLG
uniref:Uncharacterized protein n=1 Tax=Aegilops tauschii subsp. strangulata TaxID=200361 RepID=A0A452Z8A6_AEGTS